MRELPYTQPVRCDGVTFTVQTDIPPEKRWRKRFIAEAVSAEARAQARPETNPDGTRWGGPYRVAYAGEVWTIHVWNEAKRLEYTGG